MKSTTVSKLTLSLSVAIAGILAFLPFHAFLTTWAGSEFGHLDVFRVWKEILLIVMLPLALFLAWQYPQGRRWLLHSRLVHLIALYVLLHLGLGAWALNKGEVNLEALAYALIVNLRFLAFFIVCILVASSNEMLKKHWRKILVIPAAVVVAFGIAQKLLLPHDFLTRFGYGPDTIPSFQTVDNRLEYQRIQSTLRGANPLGAYLVLILTAAISLRKNRIFYGAGLGFILAALFFTYSRSAWIGAALAVGLLAGWSVKKIHKTRAIILTSFVLLLVLAAGFYILRSSSTLQDTFFHTSSSSQSPQSSNEVRARALEDGFNDVLRQPLGMGPGTAGPASFRNDSPPRIAENYYIQVAQEVGVAGLLLFILIVIYIAKQLWRKRDEPLARILLASLAAISFINLVSHAWADDTLSYIWWGLAGIAISPAILTDRRKQNGKAHESKKKAPSTVR